MAECTVDGTRLWGSITETAAIGATERGGLHRLTLSDPDRAVRDWFRAAAEAAGCRVSVDDMGNMFARRPGRRGDLAPIQMGSHLDSQPYGGRYDGVLGVLAALEAVRTLNDAGIETEHPLEVVNWTNEEGARFVPAMFASGVFAGVLDKTAAYAAEDRDGVRFGDALERIGYRGSETCGDHPVAAYFELHIEQGPVLEAEDRTIGVVTGVQGMRWFDVELRGFAGHAGTTPMHLRRDAGLGAARVMDRLEARIRAADPAAVATVGELHLAPGSRNVIPDRARLTVDLRHPTETTLEALEGEMRGLVDGVAGELGLSAAVERIWASPPVDFDPGCVDRVRRAAAARGVPHRDIVSGAGHDAVYLARVAPTAMIFVPCADGVSHNEAESIEPAHAAAGAQVLLDAVLAQDRGA